MAKFTSKNAPKGLSKGSSKGNPPKGSGSQYERGFTAQAPGKNATDRPPNLQGRVYNEFRPDAARGSTMPAPTGDTQEPRMSAYTGPKGSPAMKRGSGKGLSKGRR